MKWINTKYMENSFYAKSGFPFMGVEATCSNCGKHIHVLVIPYDFSEDPSDYIKYEYCPKCGEKCID